MAKEGTETRDKWAYVNIRKPAKQEMEEAISRLNHQALEQGVSVTCQMGTFLEILIARYWEDADVQEQVLQTFLRRAAEVTTNRKTI